MKADDVLTTRPSSTLQLKFLRQKRDTSELKKGENLEASSSAFWEQTVPHRKKLYNFIYKSLNFSQEAEDVYQETIIRALRYFRSYKKEKKFNTWLFSIAHNEIKKHYKKVIKTIYGIDVEHMGKSDSKQRVLVKDVFAYAERLRPKHREVFFLFYYNGFSITEISQIMKLKEGTIKSILNQARNTLKRYFGE